MNPNTTERSKMPTERLNTPVAFFIFNRPGTTKQVFEAIRAARPRKLLVVADGPRTERAGEARSCEETRAIVDGVDWECEVLRNFSETNLGCRRRLSSGLDWVFSECEEAIILEDDCLPDDSFFFFCQDLLSRYREDPRIMCISGDNFQAGQSRTNDSYYFSKYAHIWGWASWRRAWRYYDVEMRTWPEYKESSKFLNQSGSRAERTFWTRQFDRVYYGHLDTWDIQWLYAVWFNEGLTILPDVNLVSNIGFAAEPTHAAVGDVNGDQKACGELWDLHHPNKVERNEAADRFTFKTHYRGTIRRVTKYLRAELSRDGVSGLTGAIVRLARMSMK